MRALEDIDTMLNIVRLDLLDPDPDDRMRLRALLDELLDERLEIMKMEADQLDLGPA